MQELPPYKITPEQGWAQMAHVLDREMPVARRSRRIVIFWWSAAAVTSAFMLSLFVLLSEDKMTFPVVAGETSSSATEEQQPTSSSRNKSSATQPIESVRTENSSSSQLEKSEITEKVNPNMSGDSQKDLPKTNFNKTPNNTFADHHKINEQSTVQTQATINSVVTLDGNTIITEESSLNDQGELIIDRYADVVEFLPLVEHEMYDPVAEILVLNETIKPYIQKQPLLSPHVGVSMLEGYFGGLGIHAGAGLSVNVLPRLSVTTDIGLNVYEPDVTFLGSNNKLHANADTDNILREDINSNGIGTYLPADVVNNAAGNVISPFIQTIMQWQISAGLKYKLSRKFYAEAGGSYLFGTTSTSLYPIAEESYGSPTGFQEVSNSFDSYKVLKSNSTLLYAGLNYKPGNKWEFHAHWNHAIDPYLVNNPVPAVSFVERTDYIRGLNLGLKYIL